MNADSPGVAALARALHEAAGRNRRGTLQTKVYPGPRLASGILAALSPAEKLAIAGITEERLAEAVKAYRATLRNWTGEPARELAAGLLAALAPEASREEGGA